MLTPRKPLGGQYVGEGGALLTPEQLAERRAVAEALMSQGADFSPAGSGWEALGRAFNGWWGGKQAGQFNRMEEEDTAATRSEYERVFGGRGGSPVAAALAGVGGSGYTPPKPQSPWVIGADSVAPQNEITPGGLAMGVVQGGPTTKEEFIAMMAPAAIAEGQRIGVDPRIIIAQAAQETGWGKSAPNNNYFGIKSHGKAGGGSFATTEYINGQPVTITDSFRGYGSPEESVAGYASFLTENPRYQPMLAASGDFDAQIAALGESGYATDPNYASSVGSIARGIDLSQYGGGTTPAGPSSQDIMRMMANPRMMTMYGPQLEAQLRQVQAVEQATLEQQRRQSDPMYQAELEARTLANEAARQPQVSEYDQRAAAADQFGLQGDARQAFILTGDIPGAGGAGTPAEFQALDMRAQAAGLTPGTPEYQSFMRDGGRITNSMPAAVAALHTQAELAGLVPGSPEYKEFMRTRGAGEVAAAQTTAKAEAEMQIAAPAEINSAEDTLRYIQELREHPGRKAGTGASSWMSMIPGTSAKDFGVRVAQLEGGAFLTAIGEMQGMGALSNQEGQTAKAAIARLNTATTEEGFMAALDDYERIIKRGRDRAMKRIRVEDAPRVSDSATTEESDDDFLKRMGLQ